MGYDAVGVDVDVDFGDDFDAGSVVPLAIPKRYFDAKSVFVGNISIAGIVHSAPFFLGKWGQMARVGCNCKHR